MLLSFFIGKKFSRARQRNKLVSFISLSSTLGIAVGVAVIIIGLSAMNGFERELENRVLSVIPQAEIEGVRGPINDWQQIAKIAHKNEDVKAVAPYVRFTALIERGSKLKAVEVRAVDASFERAVSTMSHYVDQSAWQNFRPDQQQIILGKGVADKLNVKVGDSVSVLIPPSNTTNTAQLSAPKRVRLTVTGFLDLGGQIDHSLVLIPLEDGQQYMKLGNGVTGVSLKVNDVFNADVVVRQVGSKIPVYAYLKSWKEKYGFLHHDIQMVRTIMYLVMVLVIGVASFNIVSTLMMAVKDRASDIAILRTMGASDGLIKRIFIWYGVLSGVFGSIVGSVFGILVAMNLTPLIQGLEILIGHQFLSGDIYFIDFLPSQVVWSDVFLVSGTAITLSLLATWYPASRASNLNPATVLSAK
ncbi:lipoprotein-releasing ABC transporter permease subunit LolE [Vibrio sp. S17_S38]|uniref:lipoprotein-releasing ABC transporter permease subunit LolE n=1 Tax=Vibrio sp. S17_S38 TaxID=2720229 RepID=UPI001680E8CE|nr:lipoprotein-releasing ABC transporter permease subunit LolE [Vibrio sp. S17_S38]MBD1573876.1 lipoprotein-releasing ABC transporter permease subunit LolE [Vibrio sp. S17_S38]